MARGWGFTKPAIIMKAVILVDKPCSERSEEPRALLTVGGLTVLERQLRSLKRNGIETALIISWRFPETVQHAVSRFRRLPGTVKVLDGAIPIDGEWTDSEMLLLLEDGVVIDERLMVIVAGEADPDSQDSSAISLFSPQAVVAGKSHGSVRQWQGEERLFASVAKLPGSVLNALVGGTPDGDPTGKILDSLERLSPEIHVVEQIDTYMPGLRRDVPVIWRPVASGNECEAATRALIAASQKGVLDWPARFVHPPIENLLVRMMLRLPVTPNMVTLLTAILGFWATYLFATGSPLIALGLALLIGPLDGVDGKLARVKQISTKIGQLEHLVDKMVEYSWYLGLAYFLSQQSQSTSPWVLGIGIVLFSWAEGVQGELYRRLTRRQLDDTGALERGFRYVGARRNTIVWALIPFALYDIWLTGLWVMAAYTVITFFFAQWRFIVRIRDYLNDNCPTVSDNIAATRYF